MPPQASALAERATWAQVACTILSNENGASDYPVVLGDTEKVHDVRIASRFRAAVAQPFCLRFRASLLR
ncbi:hypothetical protein [Xanthomonas vesicatoria]|uniref:Uncharacterized protein n=2 Tax=Xanthomonas vesicatoria TaxID=56460 RepID=A0AAJ0N2B2_9XANT|nr:hypothetical protein [Xanthomonas vesicatoria]APP74456.1 hypothetical protein BJD12_03370 [Xanthomonas vesicatoria ATCC 35937]APO94227.1 hypothetical protein BI313_06090 [Xanthomonas vesicatoria]EGD10705.1 hypothetical protein XVE_0981 [Xanthomonas vesicatoria ATCC 35937]KHM90775.1 hypothetical protein OR61_20980 [Xanthomonas vesicatoria]KHM90893.1 hypothetical protein OR60_20895 [Xanthomonas vesicatoria]